MFIYEKKHKEESNDLTYQTLNIQFAKNVPVEKPEIVLKEDITLDEEGNKIVSASLIVNKDE